MKIIVHSVTFDESTLLYELSFYYWKFLCYFT